MNLHTKAVHAGDRKKPGAARRNRIRNCPYQMDEGSRRKD